MSNLDFPTISPFIAKPVVFSFNDAPIVFSDQILSTPIPVSFAVILFTLSEFVVNSCKLSVDCVEALIIWFTFTLSNMYVPSNSVPLLSPLYGSISNNWKSDTVSSVLFEYDILYFICPFFSIIGISTSLYNLWLARFITFIVSVDVLKSTLLLPILLIPSVPITSEMTNFVSYCWPFSLSLSICALNLIGSIACPDITPYIYHIRVWLPFELLVISGSPYSELSGIYVKPCGNVTSAFNVTFSICEVIFVFPSSCGSTLYVTILSFFPKS